MTAVAAARSGRSSGCPRTSARTSAAQAELARQADLTILCLPDDASRAFFGALGDCPCKVLDTSTAFRTDGRFAYGFPELSTAHEEAIRAFQPRRQHGLPRRGRDRAFIPAAHGGVIAADMPLSITSITGYSGGGKKMIASYEAEAGPRAGRAPRLRRNPKP